MAEEKPWWQQIGDAADAASKAVGGAVGGMIDDAKNSQIGKTVGGVVDEGQKQVDGARKRVEGAVTGAKNQATAAGSAAVAAITGEETTAPELSADQVKDVQAALGLQQGRVGPKTKAGVDAFLKQHPELGLELGDVIKGDKMVGDPKFLGAVEQYTGKDLDFFTPTPSVQEQLQKGYDAAADTLKQKGTEALGWLEQKARDACALAGTANPDGSCKTPTLTPDAQKPMDMGRQ